MNAPVALVTGAAQGIGAAIVHRLSADGYHVIANDLDQEALKSLPATPLPFDVSDSAQSEHYIKKAINIHGSLQALVNCAGICHTESIADITPENWQKVFKVNVEGAFFLARAAAESMKPQGQGSIVNIASISGFIPKLEQIAYGASKAALVSFTRSLALVYGPHQIRVNAIAPGVIDTPLTQTIAEQRSKIRGIEPAETLRPALEATPLKRIGTSQEVANAVAFLLSDQASYITGQTLNVCGGQLMR